MLFNLNVDPWEVQNWMGYNMACESWRVCILCVSVASVDDNGHTSRARNWQLTTIRKVLTDMSAVTGAMSWRFP
jgi:hypothetical protein